MSLILDALRRADSERERGEIPGLYAQPLPAIAAESPSPPSGAAWLWAALTGAGVLIVGVLAYWLSRDAQVSPAAVASAPAAVAPVVDQVVVATPPATPTLVPAPQPRPAEVQEVAEPAKWPTSDRRKPADSAPPASVLAPAEKQVALAKAPGTASAPLVEPPVLTREQLPDDIRAGLPALNVGGSIYSTDAANRSVIINGRVLRENDRVNAEIVVEQIRLKSAVLRYRGHRFEIQF